MMHGPATPEVDEFVEYSVYQTSMIKSPEVWFNQEGQLKGVEFKIVQPLADLMSTEIND